MEIVRIDPNEKVQELRKVPCEVYSRVVGYLRPISDWNLGRRQEWEDRVPYKLDGEVTIVPTSQVVGYKVLK